MRKMNQVIVKNKINEINLSSLNRVEKDFFWAVAAVVKDEGVNLLRIQNKDLIAFTKYDIKTKGHEGFKKELSGMAEKISGLINKKIYANGDIDIFSLFKRFRIRDHYLEIEVSEYFVEWFNDFKGSKYLSMETVNMIDINSTYVKDLYAMLVGSEDMQRDIQGHFVGTYHKKLKIGIDELREKLNIPPSYTVGNITQRIINKAEEELLTVNSSGRAPMVSFRVVLHKLGKKVVAFEFIYELTPPRKKRELNAEVFKKEEQKQLMNTKKPVPPKEPVKPKEVVNPKEIEEIEDNPEDPSETCKVESDNKQISYKASVRCPDIRYAIFEKMLEQHSMTMIYEWYGYQATQIETIVTKHYPHYVYGETQDELKFNEDKYKAALGVLYCCGRRQQIFENNLAQTFGDLATLKVRDPFGVYLVKEYDFLKFIEDTAGKSDLELIHLKIKNNINKDNIRSYTPIIKAAFSLINECEDELKFYQIKEICSRFNIDEFSNIEYCELNVNQDMEDFDY